MPSGLITGLSQLFQNHEVTLRVHRDEAKTAGKRFVLGHGEVVWSKNSCGVARVVFQEPSEPFATLHRAFALRALADRRKEQGVALALMISLVMIMLYVFIDGATQGCFSKQNQPRETLLLDGSD